MPAVLQRTSSVDIVIPVLNEERALSGCVRTLHAFLTASFPLPWRITIVDNGSTDRTWQIATGLAADLDHVHPIRLAVRGKGAAIKAGWRRSPADILAYMDVDLSTGLDGLLPLIAPIASGHSQLAIGTRLSSGSRITRSTRRELVSRVYNGLLRLVFRVRFTDAACGFKAVRADIARPLLDRVADDAWFFDTELLLLAEHHGLRIHEIPVDWIEDPDTRVRLCHTAANDLRGLTRVWRARLTAEPAALPRVPAPRRAHPDAVPAPPAVLPRKLLAFALIGAVSTFVHVSAYLALSQVLPVAAANLLAVLATACGNTAANRRWTFNRPAPRLRFRRRAAALLLLNCAVTTAALLALPTPAVLLAAGAAMTTLRYLAMDRWVFRP